jgi:hypothetical protein
MGRVVVQGSKNDIFNDFPKLQKQIQAVVTP